VIRRRVECRGCLLVATRIRIRIVRGVDSQAVPGTIWLDADLLDAGTFS
jgi:hypothetical protein